MTDKNKPISASNPPESKGVQSEVEERQELREQAPDDILVNPTETVTPAERGEPTPPVSRKKASDKNSNPK